MKILTVIGTFLIFIIWIAFTAFYTHIRMKKIAAERGKPDFCAYAEAFEDTNADAAIMKEVFNQVQEWGGKYDGIPFPVKAEDSFDEIYQMDEGDFEDIVEDIADKLGISLDNFDQNPYWKQLSTIKDLVLFLNYQPKGKQD